MGNANSELVINLYVKSKILYDSKVVVDSILGTCTAQTELAAIINTCKYRLRSLPNFETGLVRKQANSAAQGLARVSKFYASHHVF